LPGAAALLPSVPSCGEEAEQVKPVNQHRPLSIDGWQAVLDPRPYGIFMDVQHPGRFIYGI